MDEKKSAPKFPKNWVYGFDEMLDSFIVIDDLNDEDTNERTSFTNPVSSTSRRARAKKKQKRWIFLASQHKN